MPRAFRVAAVVIVGAAAAALLPGSAPALAEPATTTVPEAPTPPAPGAEYRPYYRPYPPTVVYVPPRSRPDSRVPLSLTLQFGGEGYTGALAPRVDGGPAWGLLLDYRPVPALGLEFGYSGADNRVVGTNQRLIRDGLGFHLRASPFSTTLEPFAFAGIAVQFLYVHNHSYNAGYSSNVFGTVPLGLGLDVHLHNFILGLRETFSPLFGHRFSAFQGTAGIWNSVLVFGGAI